jgi:hypothetical protein
MWKEALLGVLTYEETIETIGTIGVRVTIVSEQVNLHANGLPHFFPPLPAFLPGLLRRFEFLAKPRIAHADPAIHRRTNWCPGFGVILPMNGGHPDQGFV